MTLDVVAVLFHVLNHISRPHGFVARGADRAQVVYFERAAVRLAQYVSDLKVGLFDRGALAADATVLRDVRADVGRPYHCAHLARYLLFLPRCGSRCCNMRGWLWLRSVLLCHVSPNFNQHRHEMLGRSRNLHL